MLLCLYTKSEGVSVSTLLRSDLWLPAQQACCLASTLSEQYSLSSHVNRVLIYDDVQQ
jgi:hypothetical protein